MFVLYFVYALSKHFFAKFKSEQTFFCVVYYRPIVPFAMGTLGFLTPFDIENHHQVLDRILDESNCRGVENKNSQKRIWSTLRQRLRCEVIRDGEDNRKPDPANKRLVLNDMWIGNSEQTFFMYLTFVKIFVEQTFFYILVFMYFWVGSAGGSVMARLDIFAQNEKIGRFQADGIILATPTGASAYSLAAGGSIVSPTVPCMLLTPVASHSLSNRPIILPTSLSLDLKVPETNRAQVLASFDGSDPIELGVGDAIRVLTFLRANIFFLEQTFFCNCGKVETSVSPVPIVHFDPFHRDWFRSLRHKLHWNYEADGYIGSRRPY